MKYQKNIYTCAKCGGKIVTIDRDNGTTPFMILCRASLDCNGMMQSSLYHCPPSSTPTHEWYRPKRKEIRGLYPEVMEHIRKGGLLLRKIDPLDTGKTQ